MGNALGLKIVIDGYFHCEMAKPKFNLHFEKSNLAINLSLSQ